MLTEAEKYLLGAVANGDYPAFEMLFSSYYSDMCKFACSYVHSVETAEDIVSDLFVKIWEQPVILSANISLKGYLFRCVSNSCINYLTRERHNFQELNTETTDRLYKLMMPMSEDNPSTGLIVAELSEEIEKAIGALPTECGKIFIMSRKEELSHREIARLLSISENTVKVQIYRALSKLRDALKEYF